MSAPSVRTILYCRPFVFLHRSLYHPPHPKFPDLIDHLFLIVPPLCLPRFLWFSVRPTAPVIGVRFVLLPLGADIGALPLFPVPTPVGIVSRTAPALDAHCIAGVFVCAPLWIAQEMPTPKVWLILAVRIALTLNLALLEEVRSRRLVCVGSRLFLF